MRVVAVNERSSDSIPITNESQEAKNRVFDLVKRLFYITSNREQIVKTISSKIKLSETRQKQLLATETLMKKNNEKLSNKISEMRKTLDDSISLLMNSLKGNVK